MSATALTFGLGVPTTALAQNTTNNQSDVQTVPTPAADDEDDEEDVIVVTGSRLRQSAFTSSSPIGVITAEEFLLEGLANTADIVQQSPATGGAFQVNTQLTGFVTTGGPGANTIRCAASAPQRTLVLLNGRRVGPGGHARHGRPGRPQRHPEFDHRPRRNPEGRRIVDLRFGRGRRRRELHHPHRLSMASNSTSSTNFNEFGGGEQHRLSARVGHDLDRGYFNVARRVLRAGSAAQPRARRSRLRADYLLSNHGHRRADGLSEHRSRPDQ